MATSTRLRCPTCGAEMNHHANKVDYAAGHADPDAVDPVFNGVLQEVHECPNCGKIELRAAGAEPMSTPAGLTVGALAALLREAEAAHGAYERQLGQRVRLSMRYGLSRALMLLAKSSSQRGAL